jgi:hypothetical protein
MNTPTARAERLLVYALLGCGLLVLSALTFVLQDAFVDPSAGPESLLIAVGTGTVLSCLLLMTWTVWTESWGSAVAWGYMAISGMLLFSAFLWPFWRPAVIFGRCTNDTLAPCASPNPGFGLAFLLFAASFVVTLKVIRGSKARA